jgi:NitT/TauT family transport system substrate-binding protein
MMKKTFFKIGKNFVFIFYFFLIAVIISLIFFCIPGCSTNGLIDSGPVPGDTIRVGLDSFLGYAYAFIAVDKGFFKNNGVDVELVLSKEYSENLSLYEDGAIDGLFGVFPEMILYNAQGNKTIVVFITDYSDTADVIVADPLYDSLEKLKDKKIGIERVNSFSHLFVLEIFKSAGIDESELQFEIVPSQQITEALDTGKIEAGHTWNPEKTKALNKGYKIVAKAGNVPGIITDVLALNDSIIQERPSDVLAIVKSVSQARDFLETNRKEALQIMAKYEGGSAEEMDAAINEMYLLDLQDNFYAMKPSSEGNSLYRSGEIISNYYMNRGQIPSIPDFAEIINSSYVESLLSNK